MEITMIDVSRWQGKINWKKVYDDNIRHVFARSSSTYGSKKSLSIDAEFENNYKGAKENGIKIGVYHYSMATDEEFARKEARHVLDVLNGRHLDLPVAYDMEDAQVSTLGAEKIFSIFKAFAEVVEAAGYTVMLYTGISWARYYINTEDFINAGYSIWMAQYNKTLNYDKPEHVAIWQYSSTGKVNGINGNVDMNIAYVDPVSLVKKKEDTAGIKNGWVKVDDKWQYWKDNVQQKSVWVESADKTKWYYIKENGWMAEKEWIADSNKWYYLKEDGIMASQELLEIESDIFGIEKFYFAKDGHMASTNDRGALV